MAKPAGSLSLITSLVWNMEIYKFQKGLLCSGLHISLPSIILNVMKSMFTLTKEVNSSIIQRFKISSRRKDTTSSTGADNSHQNGPVEHGHDWCPCTLANTIWAPLIGANLDINFWPYAFYHTLRISNALPETVVLHNPQLTWQLDDEKLYQHVNFWLSSLGLPSWT